MGWWQIDLTDEDLAMPRWTETNMYNALPSKDSPKRLYLGDEPAGRS
jgi:hypothetical protein